MTATATSAERKSTAAPVVPAQCWTHKLGSMLAVNTHCWTALQLQPSLQGETLPPSKQCGP